MWQLSAVSADQYAAESGVEYTGVDIAGVAFLAGHFHMVVCGRFVFLASEDSCRDVADGLGESLRQPKRSAKGK